MRSTPQRRAIEHVLETGHGFVTAQEVHARLRAQGHTTGLATVYRHLAALVEQGAVDTVVNANGEAGYRSCSGSHHHHLTCTVCGRSVEVRLDAIERACARIAEEQGFRNVHHSVEFTGICAAHTSATADGSVALD